MKNFTTEELNRVERNEEGQVVINPEVFAAQIEIGWKADKFQSHYEITATDLKKILKALGLQIRKFHKPKFVIAGLTDLKAKEVSENEISEEEVEEVSENEEETFEKVETEKPKAKKATKKVVEEVVEEEVEEATTEEDLYKEDTTNEEFGGNGFDDEDEEDEWV